MQDSNRIDGYYTFIKKGDLVGVVVSNLIEPLRQISTADITTLGSSIIGSTDNFALPYFKIFCIKQQEIVYIVIDKIKIIKS